MPRDEILMKQKDCLTKYIEIKMEEARIAERQKIIHKLIEDNNCCDVSELNCNDECIKCWNRYFNSES